jgi:hypothetical protein
MPNSSLFGHPKVYFSTVYAEGKLTDARAIMPGADARRLRVTHNLYAGRGVWWTRARAAVESVA